MGNPISGFLSDIVMEDLEDEIIPKLPFTLPYCLIATINDWILRWSLKRIRNSIFQTVIRSENGDLKIVWYRKKISSGRYLNYQGKNPIGHKRNVAIALTDRAVTFTNPMDRPQSLNNVRNLLKDNGYPKDFVEKIIEQRVDRFYNKLN